MENFTENQKCTEKLDEVSPDETLKDQVGEAIFVKQSMEEQDKNEAASMAQFQITEVIDVLGQAKYEEQREVESADTPCCNENSVAINEMELDLTQVYNSLNGITETNSKIAKEIREMHKLYHNEFSNRLQSMQEELERYREMEKGRIFDGILGEIARMYSENIAVLNEITDEKINKGLRYMFLDLLQILNNYGVTKQESKVGDKRNTKHCKVIECIPTDNPELHDTVTKSLNTGFYVENRSLVKEMVHVYLYTK